MAGESPALVIVDPSGSNIAEVNSAGKLEVNTAFSSSLPSGSNNLGYVQIIDPAGEYVANLIHDPIDNADRLLVQGKVTVVAADPPSGTTPVVISEPEGSLEISVDDDTTYTITSGETFTVQQVVAGSEGDSTERGSVVEVWYDDQTTEHLVVRVYVNGFTTFVSPNTNTARDGVPLTGTVTGEQIVLRRRRLSGGAQEVDGVIRGFESTT